MTATLSSASVPITSESIWQTSGKYLQQIICYQLRKRKKGEWESSTVWKPESDVADVFAFAFASLPFAVTCSHLSFLQFPVDSLHSVLASCSFTLLPTLFPLRTTAWFQIDMAGNIIRLTTKITCIAYPFHDLFAKFSNYSLQDINGHQKNRQEKQNGNLKKWRDYLALSV